MANLLVASQNFLEVSLDGTTDFDPETDLILGGMAKNAPNGLRIKRIRFDPSGADELIIRDGQNGPAIFRAVCIDRYDNLIENYHEDSRFDRGKVMNPYIDADEATITVINQASVIFEF